MGDETRVEPATVENGLSLEQAMVSTLEDWKRCLAAEGYGGDVDQAASLMLIFSEGIRFACEHYLKPNLARKKGNLPRVDVDNQPESVGICYYRDYNMIVVPFWFLKIFEGIRPDTIYGRKNKVDGELDFLGEVRDFWFITGVQEITHGLDRELPDIHLSQEVMVTKAEYDAQPHEFRALELQLRAARDRCFSPMLIVVLERRLGKAREFQAAKRYSSTVS